MGAIELLEPRHGPLLIVGGAEDKTGDCIILRELVRLAGDVSAHIAVLTFASEYPRQVGDRYVDVLSRLGAGHLEPVHVRHRDEADRPDVLRAVETASAVYFSGGIQSRISHVMEGTDLAATLHRRWSAGLAVGGTSAGAAAMSQVMIVGSPGVPTVRPDSVMLGRGLGFLPGVIVDQHFSQRQRLGRLRRAMSQHPDKLGLGIDENTAVVVREDVCEVIGVGTVTIVDGRRSGVSSLQRSQGDTPVTMGETRPLVVSPGNRFRLPPAEALGRGTACEPMLGAQALPLGPVSVHLG